nr:putative uncharacterized protein encoded by LINC00305 [Chlorocebus sabaeus]
MIDLRIRCIIHAISATCKDEKGKQEVETGQEPSGLSVILAKVKCAKRQKTVVRVRFYTLSMRNKACSKKTFKRLQPET